MLLPTFRIRFCRDVSLVIRFEVYKLSAQRIGNLTFYCCYFSNLKGLDDRGVEQRYYILVYTFYVFSTFEVIFSSAINVCNLELLQSFISPTFLHVSPGDLLLTISGMCVIFIVPAGTLLLP
jgi:hypothetical protein